MDRILYFHTLMFNTLQTDRGKKNNDSQKVKAIKKKKGQVMTLCGQLLWFVFLVFF